MIRAAQDRDVAGIQRDFLRIEDEHQLAFEHRAEIEGPQSLHVGMRSARRVRRRTRRAHRPKVALYLRAADSCLPLVIRRQGDDAQHRSRARRLRMVLTGAVSYTALFVILLVQALRGQSILQPDLAAIGTLTAWALATAAAAYVAARPAPLSHRALVH